MGTPYIAHNSKAAVLPLQAWKPGVQNGIGRDTRTQDFSQDVARALADIEPDGGRRATILARITGAQSHGRSAIIPEPRALVETLDKVQIIHGNPRACSQAFDLQLVPKINDKTARESCLRFLSELCRDNVTLPESYILSNVSAEKRWKTGGAADVWTGKLGQEDVCIKVFRQHPSQQQEKIKGVGAISFCESVGLINPPPQEFYYRAIRWKYVSHENVLPFLGISEVVLPFGIVSPGVSNINILQYISENKDANRLLLVRISRDQWKKPADPVFGRWRTPLLVSGIFIH